MPGSMDRVGTVAEVAAAAAAVTYPLVRIVSRWLARWPFSHVDRG